MSEKILAVDDSTVVLTAISLVLEAHGYKVETARDGVEALEALSKNGSYKAIITDVNMPNMDGVTLTGEIRKLPDYSFTPIIILTTESQAQKKEEGKKAGATGWLVKPIKPDQLISVIRKIVQ